MGGKIASLADQFPLSKKPVGKITVMVDGLESSDWDYDSEQNTIKFSEGLVPAAGLKVEILYNTLKE